MNYSGVLIALEKGRFDETLAEAGRIPGVEVHQRDPGTCRAIALIEAADTGGEVEAFKALERLPGVIEVSLVNHYFEENPRS